MGATDEVRCFCDALRYAGRHDQLNFGALASIKVFRQVAAACDANPSKTNWSTVQGGPFQERRARLATLLHACALARGNLMRNWRPATSKADLLVATEPVDGAEETENKSRRDCSLERNWLRKIGTDVTPIAEVLNCNAWFGSPNWLVSKLDRTIGLRTLAAGVRTRSQDDAGRPEF